MDIRNSKSIIKDILGRYSFSSIYFENGYTWENGLANFYGEPSCAAEFLIASAVTGNKVIGFFKRVPFFKVEHFICGECVFVAEVVPRKIKWPTIFCKKPEDFPLRFALALKVSRESKLPVVFVVSPNAINGFSDTVKLDTDMARTSPYIHQSTMASLLDGKSFDANMNIAAGILAGEFPGKSFNAGGISFYETNFLFFDYLLPKHPTDAVLSLSGKALSAPESEADSLKKLLKDSYGVTVEIKPAVKEEAFETKEFLCPGCPFVNIFIKSVAEKRIVFTNISCDGLFKTFKPIYSTLDSYAGLLSNGLNTETLFIGSASSYKPHYKDYLKNGRVVFLNDCSIQGINVCSSIRHPKKFPNDKKNILYPYCCFNIKKYSRPEIKAKKCLCREKGETCDCIEKTKCPALFFSEGRVAIDANMCTGCLACKAACNFGAIS